MTNDFRGMSRMRALVRSIAVGLLGLVASACADKDLFRPGMPKSAQVSLNVTLSGIQEAAQQASQLGSFTPRFLILIAGYQLVDDRGEESIEGLLALKNFALVNGTQTHTLPVDLSPCLADERHTGGRDGCKIVVGALIRADSITEADADTSEFFSSSFDVRVSDIITVAPGRPVTVPAFDLSPSRVVAARWTGDEAFRKGGPATPLSVTTSLAGAVTSAGQVVLFVGTTGLENYVVTAPGQPGPVPYPQLAIFANGTWTRVAATAVGQNQSPFRDITALGPTEVYLAHQTGLYRYDGTNITKVSQVTDELFSVGSATTASGAKLLIAGGPNGVTWVGNTTTLTRFTASTAARLDGVCINSPTEAFASNAQTGGPLFRFNGTGWTAVNATSTAGKVHLQCTGPGQAFVTALGTALLSWNGSSWQNLGASGAPGRLLNWGAASPSELYSYGDSSNINRAFYRYNGISWVEVGRLRYTQPTVGLVTGTPRPWVDPRGGSAYNLSGSGRLERWDASGPTVLSFQPTPRDVWVNSANSAFVVGWNGFLARWDGAKWTADPVPPTASTVAALHGVWSDGPTNAWAVGSSASIFNWNGTTWTRVSDISAPVGTDNLFYSVFGFGNEVWISGTGTILKCTRGGGCTPESPGVTTTIYSLWGTSANDLWAVGAGGRILRRTAQGWTSFASPTTRTLVRVRGSGPNNIYAVGDSVLIKFDGAKWDLVSVSEDYRDLLSAALPPNLSFVNELGLFVRDESQIYVGSDFGTIGKWLGFEWTREHLPYRRRVVGISGSPSGCILAVTEGQSSSPVPILWRGEGAHGCFSTPMAGPTIWP